MGDLEKRLRGLEARTPPPPGVRLGHVSGAEIRALAEHIERLEAGWDEVGPIVEIVEPDEETAAVVRKIEWLEELERAREGRPL
jgi:hypothetical protein